jgi:hypothetical protein
VTLRPSAGRGVGGERAPARLLLGVAEDEVVEALRIAGVRNREEVACVVLEAAGR